MKYVYCFFFLLLATFSFSQREKVPTYFGLHFRPIIPSNFVGNTTLSLAKDNYKVSLIQTLGNSFGVTVRAGITKLIAFETGIMYTTRNFTTDMTIIDTTSAGFGDVLLNVKDDLKFINYEIPLNALVYVKLTNEIYMNASLGAAVRFAPTNIGKLTVTGGPNSFDNYGGIYKGQRAGINLNANYGFEYRTKKSGFFYLGGSVSIPLGTIMYLQSGHIVQSQTATNYVLGEVDGSYLGIDLKYFFHNVEKKGVQPIQGPIL
jgi:hypothetical protein